MKYLLAALFAPLLVVAVTASAAPAECDLPTLSRSEKELLTKSEEGVEALRQFVWRMRSVHAYEIHEAADFAAARRAAERRCVEALRNEDASVAQAAR